MAERSKLTNDEINELIDNLKLTQVVRRDDLTAEHIDRILDLEDTSQTERARADLIASWAHRENRPLTPDQVERLVNDTSELVRENIAERDSLTSEQIQKLVEDPSEKVRSRVACRNDLTSDQIKTLAEDKISEIVRAAIAERKDLTPDLINALANDPSGRVRRNIADFHSKKLTSEQIDDFINDSDPGVRQIMAEKDFLTPTHIEKLANDKDIYTRLSLALNKKIKIEKDILELLAEDKIIDVRNAIMKRNDCPDYLKEKIVQINKTDYRAYKYDCSNNELIFIENNKNDHDNKIDDKFDDYDALDDEYDDEYYDEYDDEYDESGYVSSLSSVMKHIINNEILDFRSNIMFNEWDNWCKIGRYDDMPGEEEKVKILESIPEKMWEDFVSDMSEKHENYREDYENFKKDCERIKKDITVKELSSDDKKEIESTLKRKAELDTEIAVASYMVGDKKGFEESISKSVKQIVKTAKRENAKISAEEIKDEMSKAVNNMVNLMANTPNSQSNNIQNAINGFKNAKKEHDAPNHDEK